MPWRTTARPPCRSHPNRRRGRRRGRARWLPTPWRSTCPTPGPWPATRPSPRTWVRRYRLGGLDALRDAPTASPGVRVLTEEEIALFCALKREVPARSLDRLIEIAEALGHIEAGKAKRSTVHRALQGQDLSARRPRQASNEDLDRFEAGFPNELWQSDMLEGPLLPDPEKRGGQRRAYLYTFLDDHSRMCLHGRFSFRGDLPALELVYRRSLQKYGKPARVYYDNGAVYRSRHMRHIVACLGIHGIVFTKAYRPMGHGKIETFCS
ncbi:MAG: DDE-type integrase/transposase/recombinase [Pseudomonadota bacterium]|nr:DDE-type integrase/transposase/recombinase [Pseudomonadota bacterium]